MVKKRKSVYTKQKLLLYFDADFPFEIVDNFRGNKYWKKRCKIYSVYDFKNSKKDDKFQSDFCKKKKFILVTLDKDFMDDKRHPINKIPGIIRIVSKKNDVNNIRICLMQIIDFLSVITFPKLFAGNSKFQVNPNYCIMRARDCKTQELKTVKINPGGQFRKNSECI